MCLLTKDLKKIVAVMLCLAVAAVMFLPAESYGAGVPAVSAANTAVGNAATVEANVAAVAQHQYVPILMYHNFANRIPRNSNSSTITTATFEAHMTWLADNGYTPLLPQDVLHIIDGNMIMPEKPVMITIDDGYQSAYTCAYPILKKTGMKATVYLIVKGADAPSKSEREKLDWEGMKTMYESGYVDIQSHSYALHQEAFSVGGKIGLRRGLIECESMYDARILPDIQKSIQLIEENVGTDVVSFSYPFGIYDPWCMDLLTGEGIKYAVTTHYGVADFKGDHLRMRRFAVGESTDLQKLLEPNGAQ